MEAATLIEEIKFNRLFAFGYIHLKTICSQYLLKLEFGMLEKATAHRSSKTNSY
jgi:hypothetical protein